MLDVGLILGLATLSLAALLNQSINLCPWAIPQHSLSEGYPFWVTKVCGDNKKGN
jgi:hypothetical protein